MMILRFHGLGRKSPARIASRCGGSREGIWEGTENSLSEQVWTILLY
jgi:hypothetical protein